MEGSLEGIMQIAEIANVLRRCGRTRRVSVVEGNDRGETR